MAFVRKIKASLVRKDLEDYIGEESYIFHDIETGELRIWDGTPGGVPIFVPGGGGGTPAGNDTEIQINDAGSFGADSAFTFISSLFTAGNYAFNIDQTVGASEDGYALTYDDASGELTLKAVTASASGSNTEIQFNSAGSLGSDSGFTFTTSLLTAGSYAFDINQTVGAPQDNFILTYDNGTGEVSLEVNAPEWINITGTITDNTDLTDYIDAATEEEMFAQQVDFVDKDLIFRAEAEPGTATSAALWRIRRLDIDNTSKGDVATTWADGNSDFDNVWDDRAILSYS